MRHLAVLCVACAQAHHRCKFSKHAVHAIRNMLFFSPPTSPTLASRPCTCVLGPCTALASSKSLPSGSTKHNPIDPRSTPEPRSNDRIPEAEQRLIDNDILAAFWAHALVGRLTSGVPTPVSVTADTLCHLEFLITFANLHLWP